MLEKTASQKARELAVSFRNQQPHMIRKTVIDMPKDHGTYYEVPVNQDGNVELQVYMGDGGLMECTTGNIMVYYNEDYKDFTVILPSISADEAFTPKEKTAAEQYALHAKLF